MEQEVAELFIQKNLKVTTAESCTGGLIAAALVNVSGISKTSTVTSNYALSSQTYQAGNRIYKVSNSGKGTALKLEVSNVKAGKHENHVDRAEFNQDGLYLYG